MSQLDSGDRPSLCEGGRARTVRGCSIVYGADTVLNVLANEPHSAITEREPYG